MGIKRLGRARLYGVEKEGINVKDTIGISDAMSPCLVSATQHRQGQQLTTDIVLDLASVASNLKSQTLSGGEPIGDVASAANPSYICTLAQSVFGVVTTIESVALESISDGTLADYDLIVADNDGRLGTAPSNIISWPSVNLFNIGALGAFIKTSPIDDNGMAGKFLYLRDGTGSATSKRGSGTIDVSSVVPANVVSGVTTVRLLDADGAGVSFVADSTIEWDNGSPSAGKFGMGPSSGAGAPAADDARRITYAISKAIHSHASFQTDATSRDATGGSNNNRAENNATSITVTHNKAGGPKTTENSAMHIIDDPTGAASGITAGSFSGGAPHSITSGKLLVRVVGFAVPDDL